MPTIAGFCCPTFSVNLQFVDRKLVEPLMICCTADLLGLMEIHHSGQRSPYQIYPQQVQHKLMFGVTGIKVVQKKNKKILPVERYIKKKGNDIYNPTSEKKIGDGLERKKSKKAEKRRA